MKKILYNANIYTMDSNNPKAEAMFIEDNLIKKVGLKTEILNLKTNDVQLIDCMGKTVMPGFNDSHMHLYGFGNSLQIVNCENSKSINEIICLTKQYIQEKGISKGNWIRGRGWNQDYFEDDKRYLTRYDLDKISQNHPIIMMRACGHLAVVNSKALTVCNITKDTKQIKGGSFDFDLGLFREKAIDLIYSKIPEPTVNEIKESLVEGMKCANRVGITSIQSDDILKNDYNKFIKAYEELNKEGKLTCRIYEQCLIDNLKDLEDFLSTGYYTGYGNEYFKIGPLKILSDGSLGARTAALTKPYNDDHSTNGILCFTQEKLEELILTAHRNNMQVAVHCIGDLAMNNVFKAIKKALKEQNRVDHRHSIIHCQITDKDLINQFKDLDVIALVQPIFLHYDIHIVESRVGLELAKTSYAFRTMLDKKIHVAYGTDCPVENLNPFHNVYCAVTRQDLNGYPNGGWNRNEKVTINDAIYQYTMGSAYASFEEEIKGSLSTGKLADLVVLSDNIFEIEPNKIKNIQVEMTFVGGELVYKR